MTGTVTIVHDDGTVTVWLHGYSIPITTSGEHFNLIARRASADQRPSNYQHPMHDT